MTAQDYAGEIARAFLMLKRGQAVPAYGVVMRLSRELVADKALPHQDWRWVNRQLETLHNVLTWRHQRSLFRQLYGGDVKDYLH